MRNKLAEISHTPPSPEPPCSMRGGAPAQTTDVKTAAPFALVIDDQEDICRLFGTTLTELGIASATYRAARPAIASLDQRRPAIIFLDVALDQSDAIDVIRGLSEKGYGGIVQLMSSGKPSLLEAIQRIAVRYGLEVRAPLQKPIKADVICAVIASVGLAGDIHVV